MSAIYGIVGESDPSELTAIGHRMGHRGTLKREWSPALSVRYGQRFTDFESVTDGSSVSFALQTLVAIPAFLLCCVLTKYISAGEIRKIVTNLKAGPRQTKADC